MQIKITSILFFQRDGINDVIVKTLIFLCCTSVFSFSSDVLLSQNAKVIIETDKTVTIFEVFDIIGSQTECTFIYESDIFEGLPTIQLEKGVIKVLSLLNKCLPDEDFNILNNKDDYITISRKVPKKSIQDKIQVKGSVKDKNGLPISGVNIIVQGTKTGTVTDFDGTYSIEANTNGTLFFSLLGYVSQTIPIKNRSEIHVQLDEDITLLDVVTLNAGYYSVREKESTGNIVKVKQKDIEDQPITNLLAAIQGRVAGVEINQTSGVPGAGFDIKIRGQNSIRSTGNDPLFIVDGVPYSSATLGTSQTSGSIIPGGTGISPLNAINSADIESIEILKDADATSIYGSRGANGVVLITTKKGSYGKTKFEIRSSSSLGSVANTMNLLNTEEFIDMRLEAFENDGIDPLPFNAYDINGTWSQDRDTDWQEELYGETAFITHLQGTLSGGNEETQFLVSGNINNQTTVYPGDFKNEKLSVLTNLNHKSKNEKLSIVFSANYTSDNNDLPSTDLVREALILAPNAPELYNPDGSLNWENSTWRNPLRLLEGLYKSNVAALIGNFSINYRITNNIDLKTNLGYTKSTLNEIRTIPSTFLDPAFGLGSEISSAIHNNADRESWIFEPQINWQFPIGETVINILGGLTFQDESSNQLTQFASGFSSNRFIESISAASNLFIINETPTEYKYTAFFTRLNINHKGRYILNLTGRRDGSSRFGPENRFSNFGAIGGAWVFSEEDAVKNVSSFLSFGKVRASYGVSGNDQIGDYQYLDTYSFGSTSYENVIGIRPTRLFNPDYSWEKNKKMEIALELGFLSDRLFFNGAYYRNISSNQLIGIPLPATTGFNSVNANLDATVLNTGWEFSLSSSNIKSSKLNWNTSINITIPRNKLLEFPNLEGSTYANQLVVGEPLNISKVYEFSGVNLQTGLYEFTDFNNDGIISAPADRQKIMDLNPKLFGGVSNNLSFQKLRLDILFQFAKQDGLNYIASSGIVGGTSNQPIDVLERWQNPGDITSFQKFSTGADPDALTSFFNHINSDATITDASYIRLKTLSISYKLFDYNNDPFGCEVFLNGQNLLTLTKYKGLDPETRSNNTLPPLRFVTLGTIITL